MSEQQKLFDLLRAGVTPFMCVNECERRLTEAGFEKINYSDAWNIVPGGKYVMDHNGTALFAFTVGKEYKVTDMIRMAAAHTDYPCLRIKPNPDFQTSGYAQINLEVYGPSLFASDSASAVMLSMRTRAITIARIFFMNVLLL